MSDKPVILFFQFDLMSHFFRSLRLAEALQNKYEVYMRHTDKYAHWLEKSGLNVFNCIDFNPETSLEKLGEYDFSWLNQNMLEGIFSEQVKIIKKYKPALVIGDTSFSLKMASEFSNVPYISILNGYFTRYYKLTRELSPTHPVEKYISRVPDFILRPIVRYKEAENFNIILKEFNKVRDKYNLRTTNHYLEEIEGDYNIICDLPEVFPQKTLPDNFHFIGPLLNGIHMSNRFEKEILDPQKRTILVTLGSSDNWERFSFLNNNEFSKYNIIIAGNNSNIMHAPFLIKTPFVDFSELSPLVDLIICHGGNGTLYNALANKTPVLCLSSHPEQYWNAKRISDLGYGQSLEKINPETYSDVINHWINRKDNIDWKLNFERFNDSFQNKLINDITDKLIKRTVQNTID